MSSWRLLDEGLRQIAETAPLIDFDTTPLAAVRSVQAARATPRPTERASVDFAEHRITNPFDGAEIRILTYRPRTEAAVPAMLHFHGGGYILGDADYSDAANETLAAATGCLIASVDYRLAPEAPWPAALEDGYAALEWLAGNTAALGVDPARIAVGGQSAGGGLAAALSLLTRDRGGVQPVYQWLIYPMLDDRTGSSQPAPPNTGEYFWTAKSNKFGWTSYLGRAPGEADVSPYEAPARAQALEGLPPAYIAVGVLDLFVDEDADYARRLIRAGVPAELHLYPGAFHGFDILGESALADRFRDDAAAALRRAMTRPS